MANLAETSTWETGIYQIEETDVVRGGDPSVSGISNVQPQQLGNRTKYLYDHIGRFEGVNEVEVSVDTTLVASDFFNKIVALKIFANGKSLQIDLSGVADGTVIKLMTQNIYSPTPANPSAIGNYTKVGILGGGTIIGTPHNGLESQLYLYTGESVTFIKSGANLFVTENNTGIESVGEILYKAAPPFMAIPASGQLLARSLYPRLWQWINESSLAVSDFYWITIGFAHKGKFSEGNGSTTFRMPDLRGMFLRARDNGRGLDLDRPDTEGSYESGSLKKHTHDMFGKKITFVNGSATISSTFNTTVPATGGNTANMANAMNTGQTGDTNQNNPINLAYTAYIKY